MPASKFDINLLSQAGISGKPLGKFLRWSLTYGRYIIILTQIVVLLAFFSRFKLDQDLSDLHSKIEEKTNIVKALALVEQNTRTIQHKLETIKTLEVSRALYFEILQTLAQNIPSEVSIQRIILSKNKLTLSGSALNNLVFSSFLNFIRRSGYFTQITLDQVGKTVNDSSIDFSVSMEIQQNSKESTQSALLKQ